MSTTLGQRVYLIREACGEGIGRPEIGADFAARLTAAADGRRTFDKSWVSRVEADVLTPRLEDIATLAAVDPRQRGREWLAWGDTADASARPTPSASPLLEGLPPGEELTTDGGRRLKHPPAPAPKRRTGGR